MRIYKLKSKEELVLLIKQSPLSLRKISKATGVALSTIEKWVYKNAMPSLDNSILVLKALGYEIEIKER